MNSRFRTLAEWRKQRTAAFKREREALERMLTARWEKLRPAPKRVKDRDVSKDPYGVDSDGDGDLEMPEKDQP